jgi:hypothetical protein
MARLGITVVVADLILVGALFLVLQDVQMRIDCSLSACQPSIARSSAGYDYSILTKSLSFMADGKPLASPPMLDWVQVLVLAIAVLNAWAIYRGISKKTVPSSSGQPPR